MMEHSVCERELLTRKRTGGKWSVWLTVAGVVLGGFVFSGCEPSTEKQINTFMEQWKNKISSCVTVAEQYLAETKDDAVMDTAVLDGLRVELAALNSVTDEQLNGVVVDYFEYRKDHSEGVVSPDGLGCDTQDVNEFDAYVYDGLVGSDKRFILQTLGDVWSDGAASVIADVTDSIKVVLNQVLDSEAEKAEAVAAEERRIAEEEARLREEAEARAAEERRIAEEEARRAEEARKKRDNISTITSTDCTAIAGDWKNGEGDAMTINNDCTYTSIFNADGRASHYEIRGVSKLTSASEWSDAGAYRGSHYWLEWVEGVHPDGPSHFFYIYPVGVTAYTWCPGEEEWEGVGVGDNTKVRIWFNGGGGCHPPDWAAELMYYRA